MRSQPVWRRLPNLTIWSLWSLPVQGQILVNGVLEPVDEILAYWYPSHRSFLNTRNHEITKRNFELRKELVDYAIIHRCSGENPPEVPD